MPDFPNTGAPMWGAGQAAPWAPVNEAGFIFDAFASRSIVEDRDLADAPGSCANGDRFLIASGTTPGDDWDGHEGEMAIAIGTNAANGWYFAIVALHGCQLFVRDEDLLIEHDGSVWATAPGGVSYMDDLTDVDAPSPNAGDVLQFDGADYVPFALGTAAGLDLDTDGTLAADSDSLVPSQKAVKTAIAAAVTGLWDPKGAIDCSTNPNYPAALKGDQYFVSVAGKIGGASGITVEVSDIIVAMADNAGGTQASVGSSWLVLQGNIVGALLAANNLSDVASAATARTNLGVNKRIINLQIVGTALTASEVLAAPTPPSGETWTFPANLSTSSGLKLSGGTNPASSYDITLKKNGSSVGTISISTSGVVSFATSGGTSFSLTGGTDELQVIGAATPDTAVGYSIALVCTYA